MSRNEDLAKSPGQNLQEKPKCPDFQGELSLAAWPQARPAQLLPLASRSRSMQDTAAEPAEQTLRLGMTSVGAAIKFGPMDTRFGVIVGRF